MLDISPIFPYISRSSYPFYLHQALTLVSGVKGHRKPVGRESLTYWLPLVYNLFLSVRSLIPLYIKNALKSGKDFKGKSREAL